MPVTFVVRVFEGECRSLAEWVETLEFETRESLAIFFANGAALSPNRYYEVHAA
jgi:hypothetical protein